MFVDAAIRRCSVDQLDETSDYDREYHNIGCPLYGKPVAYGMMNVYSKGKNTGEKLVDYGTASREVFDGMLKDADQGNSFTSLVYIKHTDGREDILCPQGYVDGMCLSGTIPFKIMRVKFRKVKPFLNFGERAAVAVEKFFIDVNKENV
jgi:hypothetical protein